MFFRTLCALSAVSLGAAAVGQDFSQSRGKPMPQFIITTVAGKKLTNKSLRGKVVVFDFWATWCGPCKASSPAIQKLYTNFSNKGVVVIGADTFENKNGPSGAKAYAAEHKYKYLFTYENDGLARSLGITAIPAFAVVDRNGIVRDAVMGLPKGDPAELYRVLAKRVQGLLKS